MIDRLKQWIKEAVDAFLRGVRGASSSVTGGKPAGWGLLVLRDAIIVFIELVLTAAALFTFIQVPNLFVKIILAVVFGVSGMRTYTASKQLLNVLFPASNSEK